MKRYTLLISGRVRDVSFRDFVRKHALQFNITGYVRNRKDGNVEVVAEGKEYQLKKLVSKCRTGPLLAKVEKVDLVEAEATREFEGFDFRF